MVGEALTSSETPAHVGDPSGLSLVCVRVSERALRKLKPQLFMIILIIEAHFKGVFSDR